MKREDMPFGRVTLRKMTMKSEFTTGKYVGRTVDELINGRCVAVGEGKGYIRWCYYCQSNITFEDDILEICGVVERIKKPGTNLELFETQKKIRRYVAIKNSSIGQRVKFYRKMKAQAQRDLIIAEAWNQESKASLQARNHGHKR